jgi:hypothetical protein
MKYEQTFELYAPASQEAAIKAGIQKMIADGYSFVLESEKSMESRTYMPAHFKFVLSNCTPTDLLHLGVQVGIILSMNVISKES